MYIITTPRIGLRQWKESDVATFAEMVADPEVMRYFPSTRSLSEAADFVHRVSTFIDANGYGFWAADELISGEFIGFIGLMQPRFESYFTPCIEIGWRLRKEYWNQGLATEGARACLEYGFMTLDVEEIYSFTPVENKPSERVMQKIGMIFVNTFEHPAIEEGHRLREHLLYKIARR